MKVLFTVFILLLATEEAEAYDFKFRAREHYEIHNITAGGQDYKFRGLSNTINAWFEKPYDFSIGLAFSPVLAGIKADETYAIGEKLTLYNVGIEAKYFPKLLSDYLYGRGGVGYSHLENSGLGKQDGYNVYFGLGYEIPFKSFGIALEAAIRQVELNNDISDQIFTPSVGLHFYKML